MDEGVQVQHACKIKEPPEGGFATLRMLLDAGAPRAFVKFLGKSDNRKPPDWSTIAEIKGDGCHWASTYRDVKRPIGV